MTKKLIATNFTYEMIDNGGRITHERGSYLGRKKATRNTIMRFLRSNANQTGWQGRCVLTAITGSYTSQWIAK